MKKESNVDRTEKAKKLISEKYSPKDTSDYGSIISFCKAHGLSDRVNYVRMMLRGQASWNKMLYNALEKDFPGVFHE